MPIMATPPAPASAPATRAMSVVVREMPSARSSIPAGRSMNRIASEENIYEIVSRTRLPFGVVSRVLFAIEDLLRERIRDGL